MIQPINTAKTHANITCLYQKLKLQGIQLICMLSCFDRLLYFKAILNIKIELYIYVILINAWDILWASNKLWHILSKFGYSD